MDINTIKGQLYTIISSVAGIPVPSLKPDDVLCAELPLNSADVIDVVNLTADHFHFSCSPDAAAKVITFEDLLNLVKLHTAWQ